jgi:transposase
MKTQEKEKNRKQLQIICIDDLVPQDHLLRMADKAIDWTFIYELVQGKYFNSMDRPGINPVALIKIPFIQYSVPGNRFI